MKTFTDLIESWPGQTRPKRAAAFSKDIGVSYDTARKMRDNNSIPAKYWRKVIKAAKKRGVGRKPITCEVLMDMTGG